MLDIINDDIEFVTSRPAYHRRSFTSYQHAPALAPASRRGDIVQVLDLDVSPSIHLAEALDGSILRALRQLDTLRERMTDYSSDNDLDEAATRSKRAQAKSSEAEDLVTNTATDTDGESTADEDVVSQSCDRTSPTPIDRDYRLQRDLEALEAFLQTSYEILAAVRDEVAQTRLPSLPSADQIRRRASSRMVDLANSYQKANAVLSQLALFTATTLPEMPALPSLAGAKASFADYAAKRRATISSPAIPSPPLAAIRSFLTSESSRLSSRLPSCPPLDEWGEGLSHVLQEASHFVQDEGEKIVDFVRDEADKLRTALRHGTQRLLEYHELPHDWKNNKYILSGYRFIPIDRPWDLLKSGLYWHNETINIYTHFIPALYIPYYLYFVFPRTTLGDPLRNTLVDRAISVTFLLAAEVCLLLSAAWHLASGCGTFSVFHSCATLDYLGISALISSSVLTVTHQGFRCLPKQDFLYNSATCLLGALGLYLPWKQWFNKRENKSFRIAFFLLLSAAGAAPMTHMAFLFGAKETWKFCSPVGFSLLAYIVGLLFYVFDFPEVLRPGGMFDTLFHSHQFWHCAIVAAIALHWWALSTMSEMSLVGFSCADRQTGLSNTMSTRWHSEL